MTGSKVPASLSDRLARVRALGRAYSDPVLGERLIRAYVGDTAFRVEDATHRELTTPAALCGLPVLDNIIPDGAEPLGTVAVVVPRNSVGLTIAKAVVGAWLGGNRVIVRLPNQLRATLPLMQALISDHLPGVLFAPHDISGAAFLQGALSEPDVAAVVIYGDDAWIDAYRPLAERSGKHVLFEGPGNDPLLVVEGADVDAAVAAAIRGGLHNGGQSCSAFERFFVHRSLHDSFVRALVERLSLMRIGPPEDLGAAIGPIGSSRVLHRIVDQIDDAVRAGATLHFGGEVVPDVHSGMPAMVPAVLTGCTAAMTVMRDETFGPVFPIVAFDDDDDLLPAVDATRYGLNAAVFGPSAARHDAWLVERHRNVYLNATPFDRASLPTRIVDGGYRRSGLHWVPVDGALTTRHGPRILANTLVRNSTPTSGDLR
jgi:succinate-semialdehyde dehydrogenase/glutarate-semialdehyde dehydrogenase